MSSKPQSFRSFICPFADSSIASAVGCPYFAKSGFSRLPPFTPILIGILCKLHSLATFATFSGPPILPGFMRILSAPRRAASMASLWSKWISATMGRLERSFMAEMALAASMSGTARRTMSQPAAASAEIWRSVASTSWVLVQHMD